MDELERNLASVVAEMALKLDLRDTPLSLNYPLATLNALTNAALDMAGMQAALEAFARAHEAEWGLLGVEALSEGFCLTVPGRGVARMRDTAPGGAFLGELLAAVRRHGATVEDALAVFRRHGERVRVERVDSPEFDWLVYFEDGRPDAFRYCLSQHDGHVSYHRFSKADYDAFAF